MKHRIHLLLATALASALASATLAQQSGGFTFERLVDRHDRNGNGAIEREEFRGDARIFKQMDTNKDGVLEKAEFEASRKRWQEIRNHAQQGKPKPQPRKVLEGVTVLRDLEYAVIDDIPLELDLYLPKKSETPPPLLVWIHGGGWKSGDKARVNQAILRLSTNGYAVASINYRLQDLSIHPKNIHDCKGAVRWLRSESAKYGYDPKRVAVGGGSAGGHLALLLGLSGGVEDLEGTIGGNLDQSSSVSAIVDFYGPSELAVLANTRERPDRARKLEPEQLLHASPLTYLTKDDPPVIIFHGDADATVPVAQSKLLHNRYEEMGLESQLHILEGAGHGGPEFSDDTRYALIRTFLDRHLRAL